MRLYIFKRLKNGLVRFIHNRMFYFEIQDNKEKVLFSTLKNYPGIENVDMEAYENIKINKDWYLYGGNTEFTVKIFCTEGDAEALSSNRRRALAIEIFLNLAPQLQCVETSQRQHFDAIIQRFIHNLVNVNKKLKGAIQSLASEKAKNSESKMEFIAEVKRRIENNTHNAAAVINNISKRTADLDSQITGLRLISGFSEGLKASLINIDLRQALNRFILDFNDEIEKSNSIIKLEIPSGIKVRIDYDLLKFAFSQFFDNSSKYILPGCPLIFSIYKNTSRDITIECRMTSLKIYKDEINNIFFENTRGKEARKVIQGNGLGMFMIRKALKLMGGSIYAECNNSEITTKNENEYGENSFFIKINKG